MFPELDDLTYTPHPSSRQLTDIKSRGARLHRWRTVAIVAAPVTIAVAATVIAFVPTEHARPSPEPAAPPHELGPVVTLPVKSALSIVEDPLEQGADLAVIVDITPGPRLRERLFLVSGTEVRKLPPRRDEYASEPALSPNGQFVAYHAFGSPSPALKLLDITTGTKTAFDDQRASVVNTGLWWSSDSQTIADGYWEVSSNGKWISPRVRIWQIGTAGTITGPIADGPVTGDLLGMSPGGDELLALTKDGEVLTSETTNISFLPTGITATSTDLFGGRVRDVSGVGYSPDGDHVGAFVKVTAQSNSDSKYHAWVLDLHTQRWQFLPLARVGYEWRPPAGWYQSWLTQLDSRPGIDPAVVRPVRAGPDSEVVLTFRPSAAEVQAVSLATGRVYYSSVTSR